MNAKNNSNTPPGLAAQDAPAGRWTVLIPFYNERDYLPRTLRSLCEQSLPPSHFILVDNACTDDSVALARAVLHDYPHIDARIMHEPRPGKIQAMQCGLKAVTTPFVATCDADTWYPPDYLAKADALFAVRPDAASVMAIDIYNAPQTLAARLKRLKTRLAACLLAHQCHTGGFGQMFRTAALRRCGGFDARLWPFVLEDHEIIHRLLDTGPSVYHQNLWCMPADRRTNGARVSWRLSERVLYHLVPRRFQGWFFYRFLATRLRKRRLDNTALRERNWA